MKKHWLYTLAMLLAYALAVASLVMWSEHRLEGAVESKGCVSACRFHCPPKPSPPLKERT